SQYRLPVEASDHLPNCVRLTALGLGYISSDFWYSPEFIPFSFWYDVPLTSPYSDRRHDPWQVYGSPTYSPARWSSWISPAWRSTSFGSLSCPSGPRLKPGGG